MILLLPIIGVVGGVYFIGGDIQNVKVFYHNDDYNCMLLSSKQYCSLSYCFLATYVDQFISDASAADEFDLVTNGNQLCWYFIVT